MIIKKVSNFSPLFPIYPLSTASDIGPKKLLLSSPFGKFFITTEEGLLLGYYSVEHYRKTGKLEMLEDTLFYQDDGDGKQQSDISIPLSIEEAGCDVIPIVSGKGIVTGAIICTDESLHENKVACLSKLEYLADKGLSLEYWFLARNYKNIAFWGLDRLSAALANEIRRYPGVNVLGIYEDSTLNEMSGRIVDKDNYDTDVHRVDSIEDVCRTGADLIIITDWTMRHLENSPLLKDSNADVIYAPSIFMRDICFDYGTHILDEPFTRYVNAELYDRLKAKYRAMGCNFLTVAVPDENDLKIPPKNLENGAEYKTEWIAKQSGFDIDSEEVKNLRDSWSLRSVIKRNGIMFYSDYKSSCFNYTNKSRVILNAPSEYKNVIYIIGPCIAAGAFHTDNHVLGYYMQENINDRRLEYKVVMIGMPNEADRYYFMKILEEYDIKEGDKIFLICQTRREEKYDLDTLPVFETLYEKYGYEFYLDIPIHCGKEANKAIADFLTEHIDDPFVSDTTANTTTHHKTVVSPPSFSGDPQLRKYQEFIQSSAIHKMPEIGSIVMNCNPFTLGHLHLIEYAAGQVDYLYIFVVEEDKSFFRFEDRIELVKAGTSHLENVKILPSGRFIISNTTFAEYFDKENSDGAKVDTSLDVETFGSQIAPFLNISVRFVGEEPLDFITAQYNRSMKEILPKYGIELREIPRKETDGVVISASRVRKCLEEKNWEEIKKLVPETTYSFLEEKFRQ